MTIETPERNPTAHFAIAGTGRAGTELFSYAILPSWASIRILHATARRISWDEHANAGLETVPLTSEGSDLPYVVKYPWLHQCIDHILTSELPAI